jgi:hypothetical protein
MDRSSRWALGRDSTSLLSRGGCHLTRPTVDLLKGAGFTIGELDIYYERGAPKALGANSLGVASAP